MAETTFTLTHSRASDYRGTASMPPRLALQHLLNLLDGAMGGSYGATGFSVAGQASGTVTLANADGVQATGTVTLSSAVGVQAEGTVALSGVGGTAAFGTVTLAGAVGVKAAGTVTLAGGAGDVTITVGGTAVGPVAFNATDAQTALDCITALNADPTVSAIVTASDGGSAIITIESDTFGTGGNSITLSATRTAGTATASGATLTGGLQAVTVVVDGTSVSIAEHGVDDEATAALVVTALNADPTVGALITATSLVDVITLTADVKGTAGNAITLTSAAGDGDAIASGATLSGGAQGSVGVTVNGTLVTTDTTDLTDTAAATAVAAALEADGTLGPLLAAVGNVADVEITWGAKGTVGNAVTLSATSATGTATASGATLAGGLQAVTVVVGGTSVSIATEGADDTATAVLVVTALNANPTVAALITATSALGVITLTADAVGSSGNSITLTSAAGGGTATASGGTLTGGAQAVTVVVDGNTVSVADAGSDDTATAILVAAALNADGTVAALITATSSGAVVTLTADATGAGGDALTLTSTAGSGTATASGATLSGGAAVSYTF